MAPPPRAVTGPSARSVATALLALCVALLAPLAVATHYPDFVEINGTTVSLLPRGRGVRIVPPKVNGRPGRARVVLFKRPRATRRPRRIKPRTSSAKLAAQGGALSVTLASTGQPADLGGAWYDVAWSGIDSPLRSDRISVYYGQNPDIQNGHPALFHFAAQVAPGTWASGSGSVRVWLPLTRDYMTFGYQRSNPYGVGIWLDSTMKATAMIEPSSSTGVQNVKLSVAMDPKTGRRRTRAIWNTAWPDSDAALRWKPEGGSWTVVPADGDRAPTRDQMCSSPANYYQFPGMSYSALFGPGDLPPNTRIVYQVGRTSGDWSPEFAFATPPDADDPTAETRFLITADMGMYAPDNGWMPDGNMFSLISQAMFYVYMSDDEATPDTQKFSAMMSILVGGGAPTGGQQPGTKPVMDALAAEITKANVAGSPYHGIAINGDISYARGEALQWEVFSTLMQPVLTQAVGFHTAGNHDADDTKYADTITDSSAVVNDAGGECAISYRSLFRMPQPSGNQYDWYSFRMGPVAFVQINTEQQLTPGSRQLTWLDAELAKVNRTAQPWLVVSGHRPIYVDTVDGGDQALAASLLANVEPLLAKYEVDLFLTGHIHQMQRSCKGVYKGGCVAPDADGTALAPTHIMTGNAGFQSPLMLFTNKPGWLEAQSFDYGYTKMIATHTSIKLTSVSIKDGGTLDEFELTKPAGWAPNRAAAAARYAAAPTVPGDPGFAATEVYTFMSAGGTRLLDDDGFAATYLQPGSTFWKLVNSPPGRESIFDIQDVWQVTYPVLDYFKNNIPWYWPSRVEAAINYLWQGMSPGGRMYFGPVKP